jgi:uncharacterized protein with NRDE domain
MCLIAWHWHPGGDTPLVLIANRDEFFARPTLALHRWPDTPILAGRDLQAGGTWLGIDNLGRVAALTNHRDPSSLRPDAPSRGALVSDFLNSTTSAQNYLTNLLERSTDYNPFNLLVFDGYQLMGLESRHTRIVPLQPGVGAVSNADFFTPWPKLSRIRLGLQRVLLDPAANDAELLALLHDQQFPADENLPTTGIDTGLERALSTAFVRLPDYGTRACSILRIKATSAEFFEQTFGANGLVGSQRLTTTLASTVR